jgi:hypothetical protein
MRNDLRNPEPDHVYFHRRASEEEAAASHAADELAEAAHRELASRYAQLAAAIREAHEKLGD